MIFWMRNTRHPTKFKAIWNYPDGDFVYFDGLISKILYEE